MLNTKNIDWDYKIGNRVANVRATTGDPSKFTVRINQYVGPDMLKLRWRRENRWLGSHYAEEEARRVALAWVEEGALPETCHCACVCKEFA